MQKEELKLPLFRELVVLSIFFDPLPVLIPFLFFKI